MSIKSTIMHWLPIRDAQAHCDIPCGIYDPINAKIGAQTVQKMVLRMQQLQTPGANASSEDLQKYENSMTRYIHVKEEHAEIVKHELDVLWHDYFKPEHLEKYPDLHDKFWQATKLASQNKHTVDMEAAKQLVASVDDIATIFWDSKGVKYSDPVADVRFGT